MHDTSSNDLVAQAIEEIKPEQGLEFSKEKRPIEKANATVSRTVSRL